MRICTLKKAIFQNHFKLQFRLYTHLPVVAAGILVVLDLPALIAECSPGETVLHDVGVRGVALEAVHAHREDLQNDRLYNQSSSEELNIRTESTDLVHLLVPPLECIWVGVIQQCAVPVPPLQRARNAV